MTKKELEKKVKKTVRKKKKTKVKSKNPMGRPTKLTRERLDAAKEVITGKAPVKDKNNDEEWKSHEVIPVIIFTDEELLLLINKKVSPKFRMSETTFEEFKAGKQLKNAKDQDILKEFSVLIKEALSLQRACLFTSLEKEPVQRQKRAWIIERKFTAWNLKVISENTNKNEDTVTIKEPSKDELANILEKSRKRKEKLAKRKKNVKK